VPPQPPRPYPRGVIGCSGGIRTRSTGMPDQVTTVIPLSAPRSMTARRRSRAALALVRPPRPDQALPPVSRYKDLAIEFPIRAEGA
jgi:hypothetical protein